MLTGRKPFVEDEQRSVMHKIRLEKHVRCRKLNPDIPRELERIVDKCLRKQPRDRWRSAQHCVMALERFLAKHVEMNHHARVVLFLRNQNVITQLEADEYLNPAFGGQGTSALAQPNIQARQNVRRAALAHGIMIGMVALMLGLIHIAPLGAAGPPVPTIIQERRVGHLAVNATPWARVVVDGKQVAVTPLARPIELTTGSHTVRFEHDWYQPIERTVEIKPGNADSAIAVSVDWKKDGRLAAGKTVPPPPPESKP
jgi:serine/threonine-protein kinase